MLCIKSNELVRCAGSIPMVIQLVIDIVGLMLFMAFEATIKSTLTLLLYLQVMKGHPTPSSPREQPAKKSAVPSISNHVSKPPSWQSRSRAEATNDTSVVDI
ncbi:hypothetical protein Tco_1569782 [Tanacetum coccineum]